MNKTMAHIILIFIDIFAVLGLYWGWFNINQIVISINNNIDPISFSNRIGFFVIGIGLPLGHIFIICDHFWKAYLIKKSAIINFSFIVFGTGLFFIAIFISFSLQHYIEEAGYQYCSGASGVSSLARTLVYTKNSEICSKITAERRARLGLPPKLVNR